VQTENWDSDRRAAVLAQVAAGLGFWTSRANRPEPLTFQMEDLGILPTSCEPIRRPYTDQGKWIADVLNALGYAATESSYHSYARLLADDRRRVYGADWAALLFVLDSLNDPDGLLSDGRFAYAYLNGPFQVQTYDNNGWGIAQMHLVTAHETGHLFGAYDEYASSGCSPLNTWGYLVAPNASCNNGGLTSDLSIMGEAWEQVAGGVDVDGGARHRGLTASGPLWTLFGHRHFS
jgi:hypothetical protein